MGLRGWEEIAAPAYPPKPDGYKESDMWGRRFPGRVDADETTFASVADLAAAMRRAEAAHVEHEKRTGERDANWADWYAEYMLAEQAGKELPQ